MANIEDGDNQRTEEQEDRARGRRRHQVALKGKRVYVSAQDLRRTEWSSAGSNPYQGELLCGPEQVEQADADDNRAQLRECHVTKLLRVICTVDSRRFV